LAQAEYFLVQYARRTRQASLSRFRVQASVFINSALLFRVAAHGAVQLRQNTIELSRAFKVLSVSCCVH